jgi:type II secretory pathway predicted ATPase ExeA
MTSQKKGPHPLLEPFRNLHISYRTAAREMGISHGMLYNFLAGTGNPKTGERKNPAPLIRAYIDGKRPAMRVKSEPMMKKMFGMGLGLDQAATAMDLSRGDLSSYLASGMWPNAETAERFRKWLEEQREKRRKKMITKTILTEEVWQHFGLKMNPFPHELRGVEDIIEIKDLAVAEKKVLMTINRGGWCAIAGCTGSGKTTLIKKIEFDLEKRKDVVLSKPKTIERRLLGAAGLCDAILEDLKWTWSKRQRLELRARYVGDALDYNYRNGKKVVLLVDEAHLLADEALLALKRFYEFEIGFKKLLVIVLIGQEPLAERLKTRPQLAEVAQRVDLYEIKALNGQFARYLREKLQHAGMNGREIFDSSAIKAIHVRMREAGGFYTPQSLQNLAASAMVTACDLGEKIVTERIVRAIPGSY